MGIRVHKVIGYGLSDVEPNDVRIDFDAVQSVYDLRANDYRKWLDKQPDDDRGMPYAMLEKWHFRDHPEGRRYRDLTNCVRYDTEYGLPNVLLVAPLACRDWSRYDDMIDWIEETYLTRGREPQTCWVEVLPHGIYPWSASYMDRRSGEKLPETVMNWIRHHSHIREMGESPHDAAILTEYARGLGFDSDEQAQEFIRPTIPQEVEAVCRFVGTFKETATIRDLRPMVYVWWS